MMLSILLFTTLTNQVHAIEIGATAPDLPAVDGEHVVTLVNFWASWCGPCLEELPALDSLYNRLQGTGATVLAINIDTNQRLGEKFIKKNELDLPVTYDPKGQIANRFEPPVMPTTYIIRLGDAPDKPDPKGFINLSKKLLGGD